MSIFDQSFGARGWNRMPCSDIGTPARIEERMAERGGKREGAGRKPKPESERLQQVTVWLTQEQIDHCREKMPNMGLSEYLRAVISSEMGSST